MLYQLTGALGTAILASIVGVAVVRKWAIARGYVDHPDSLRRIHARPTPRLGGVAVAVVSTLAFLAWSTELVRAGLSRPEYAPILLGGLAMFAVGFWDDTREMRAGLKFLAQIIVAAAVFFAGVRVFGYADLAGWPRTVVFALSFLVTTFWLVGTTNAFNLIDGSDGVAAGSALFSSVALGAVFLINGDAISALMCAALAGTCIGFLVYNFPPASVFLGDCGSLYLGFALGSLGVMAVQDATTAVGYVVPAMAFGVPLLDTTIAIVRRFLRHEPIFAADRGHIHHRLASLGYSPRGVAVVLCTASAGCASLAILLAAPRLYTALPVLLVAGVVLLLGVYSLRMPELAELSGMARRALEQREVISHNLRVHALASSIGEARTIGQFVAALEEAFVGSEFTHLDLWVDRDLGRALEGCEGVSPSGAGYVLHLKFEDIIPTEREVEVTVPLWDGANRAGKLTLYRSADGSRLFTDVRLLGRLVMPSITRGLRRLSHPADAGQGIVGV